MSAFATAFATASAGSALRSALSLVRRPAVDRFVENLIQKHPVSRPDSIKGLRVDTLNAQREVDLTLIALGVVPAGKSVLPTAATDVAALGPRAAAETLSFRRTEEAQAPTDADCSATPSPLVIPSSAVAPFVCDGIVQPQVLAGLLEGTAAHAAAADVLHLAHAPRSGVRQMCADLARRLGRERAGQVEIIVEGRAAAALVGACQILSRNAAGSAALRRLRVLELRPAGERFAAEGAALGAGLTWDARLLSPSLSRARGGAGADGEISDRFHQLLCLSYRSHFSFDEFAGDEAAKERLVLDSGMPYRYGDREAAFVKTMTRGDDWENLWRAVSGVDGCRELAVADVGAWDVVPAESFVLGRNTKSAVAEWARN